ncbi:hypothetical protein P8452_50505 [Trifolium repens]|nr:hypothetical protein P8452_50505 [Trifolium repens]
MLTELIIFFYCCFFRLDVQHQTPNYIAFWSILQIFSPFGGFLRCALIRTAVSWIKGLFFIVHSLDVRT